MPDQVHIATITYEDGPVYDYWYDKVRKGIHVRWKADSELPGFTDFENTIFSEEMLTFTRPHVLVTIPGLMIAREMLRRYMEVISA